MVDLEAHSLCDFGKYLKEPCHKTHFTTKIGLKDFNDYDDDLKEIYLWRAGTLSLENELRVISICFQHEWKLGADFERRLEHLEKDNVMTESHDKEPMDFGETDLESSFSRFESTEAINESLEVLGESPIKLHSVPKHRGLAYANSKFEATVTSFKQSFAAAVGVQKEKIMEPEAPHLSRIVMTKAKDFDKLMEQIRDKLSTVSSREKVQLLTLTPESWSIKEASSYFQVSEYFVKRARELKTEQGILACPGK